MVTAVDKQEAWQIARQYGACDGQHTFFEPWGHDGTKKTVRIADVPLQVNLQIKYDPSELEPPP
jgi:hypothetical protein